MIWTADSSVWVAYLKGEDTPETLLLDTHMDNPIVGDLVLLDVVLMEVLRGCRHKQQLLAVEAALAQLPVFRVGGEEQARKAAHIYRDLRARGITVRSTIDLLIGTWCIENGAPLLHADRDFDGMEKHHGLQVWGH